MGNMFKYTPNDAEAKIKELQRALVEQAARIAELKAALAWYADENNYVENFTSMSVYCPDSSLVQKDEGERARKALGGSDGS